MKTSWLVFICCVSALRVENHKLIFMKTVGEDFRFSFGFNQSESSLQCLCNSSCKNDVFICANGARAKSSRYEVKYDDRENKVQLEIRELKRSDEGRYRYAQMGSSKHQDFEIRVRALCDGGLISGGPRVHRGPVGGSVTVRCSLNASQHHRKFFYKRKPVEMLMETSSSRAEGGRFSMESGSNGFFNVTITELKTSDSGRYRCGVRGQDAGSTCQEFEVAVQGRFLSRVALLIMVVLFLIFLLVLYGWRINKSHGRQFPPYSIN